MVGAGVGTGVGVEVGDGVGTSAGVEVGAVVVTRIGVAVGAMATAVRLTSIRAGSDAAAVPTLSDAQAARESSASAAKVKNIVLGIWAIFNFVQSQPYVRIRIFRIGEIFRIVQRILFLKRNGAELVIRRTERLSHSQFLSAMR